MGIFASGFFGISLAPVAMMMIHNPITVAIGDSKEMQKAGEMLEEVKEGIMNAYEIKTGMDRKKISHLMDAESWFNAKHRRRCPLRKAARPRPSCCRGTSSPPPMPLPVLDGQGD